MSITLQTQLLKSTTGQALVHRLMFSHVKKLLQDSKQCRSCPTCGIMTAFVFWLSKKKRLALLLGASFLSKTMLPLTRDNFAQQL